MGNSLQNQLERWLALGKHHGIQSPDHENFALGTGKGPRPENQDRSVFFRFTPATGQGPWSGGILCDGIGGQKDGGKCAEIAISSLLTFLISNTGNDLADHLEKGIQYANHAVFETYQGEGGTTLCAFLHGGEEVVFGNVGDSRIYLVARHDGQVALHQISIDDTLYGALPEQRKSSLAGPQPGQAGLIQYIGMGADMTPHITRHVPPSTTAILLTSDGVHGINQQNMEKLFKAAPDAKSLMERLMRVAVWLDGDDNVTALEFVVPDPAASLTNGYPKPGWVHVWQPDGTIQAMEVSHLDRKTVAMTPAGRVKREPLSPKAGKLVKSKKRPGTIHFHTPPSEKEREKKHPSEEKVATG